MKVKITIDDVRLGSYLTINQALILTKRPFVYTIFGFTQSHQGLLNDIQGFYQILPGKYTSQKPNTIIGIDKSQLNCDCVHESLVKAFRETIQYFFALSSHQIIKYLRNQD